LNKIFFLLAAFSAFLLGTTFGWSSPVQPQLQQVYTTFRMNDLNQTSLLYTLHLDGDQMSWVGSLLNIGALFGALCGGLLMDKFGRRFVLMTMTSPYIIGWLMITLALDPSKLLFIKTIYFSKFNLYFSLSSVMLYVGRVIVGFAGGVCAAIAPCYIGTSVLIWQWQSGFKLLT
jgi:SP family facilitated glucose transporter-like MFS transporter 8